MATCRPCQGTGWVECKKCDGSGWVKDAKDRDIKCPTCGTLMMEHKGETKCRRCGGTGEVGSK
jgi:ribosomal protein S27AE